MQSDARKCGTDIRSGTHYALVAVAAGKQNAIENKHQSATHLKVEVRYSGPGCGLIAAEPSSQIAVDGAMGVGDVDHANVQTETLLEVHFFHSLF